MEWSNGRQLDSYTKNGETISYTYDDGGMRLSKTVDGVKYTYLYEGGLLVQETRGSKIFDYSYDANGRIRMVVYRATASATPETYYYALNSRNDVIGIYTHTGKVFAKYEYDVWGNLLSITNQTGGNLAHFENIATLQPFRYRSYYYDTDSGLYYLQSRYYDPVTHRFINADTQLNQEDSSLGYNMFAYCNNNPVNQSDPDGHLPKWAKKLAIAAAVVAVVAVVAAVTVATAGAGSAIAAVAIGAAKGAAIGFAVGAATGAAGGAISHRVATGSWKGAGNAALNGMADGALSGAITGTFTGGISGGINAVSQSSSRVLWSGGDAAKNAAASYAKSIGGATLEQTPKGKMLTGLTKICGYNKTQSLWQQASVEFAGGARGNITAIVSRSGYRGAGSILSQFEYPMVASRIMDGLAESFNVILIG